MMFVVFQLEYVITIPIPGKDSFTVNFPIGWRPININSSRIEATQTRNEYFFMARNFGDKLSINYKKMLEFGKRKGNVAIRARLEQLGIKRDITE